MPQQDALTDRCLLDHLFHLDTTNNQWEDRAYPTQVHTHHRQRLPEELLQT